jgi:hypothetical protein
MRYLHGREFFMVKNKKKKSRFKTGIHFSTKMNRSYKYRSGYELKVYQFLDTNQDVSLYFAEPFKIPYNYSKKTVRNYIPDILIVYKSGEVKLIEIKPLYKTTTKTNQAKFASARKFCETNKLIFEVWTEFTLKELIKE